MESPDLLVAGKRRSHTQNLLPDGEWKAVSGWPLSELGAYAVEVARPSLLLFANRARPLWRQAIYVALATEALNDTAAFIRRSGVFATAAARALGESLADLLPNFSPVEILTGCFGETPVGLMPILRKLGHHPLKRETYHLLAQWHQNPAVHAHRCRLLQHMVLIDQGRVDAVEMLDSTLLTPAVIPFLVSSRDAKGLNEAVSTIRRLCHSATDEALRESAKALQGEKTITAWVRTWLRKADRLPIPFQGDSECRPLRTGAELEDAGKRFKNCLGNHCMTAVLSGRISVVEYLPEPAVALLARLSGEHWVVGSIHGPKNNEVSNDLSNQFQAKLMTFGPHIHAAVEVDASQLAILRNHFGDFEPFEIEWLGLDA